MDLASIRGPQDLATLYRQSPKETFKSKESALKAIGEMWIGLNDREMLG